MRILITFLLPVLLTLFPTLGTAQPSVAMKRSLQKLAAGDPFMTMNGDLCMQTRNGRLALVSMRGEKRATITHKQSLLRSLDRVRGGTTRRQIKQTRALKDLSKSLRACRVERRQDPLGLNDKTRRGTILPSECRERLDINQDRSIDSADISAFITMFLNNESEADFNLDGTITSQDINDYLAAWLLAVQGLYECPGNPPTPTPTPTPTPPPGPTPENTECIGAADYDFSGLTPLGCAGPNQQITLTDYGFTIFTPSVDTRITYVSSSLGSDSNDGLTPQTPKRTLLAGYNALRSGFPDWLLLKRGDVWENEVFGNQDGFWFKNGRSESERILIASYGPQGARPLLRTGARTAFRARVNGPVYNIILSGIEAVANFRDPSDTSFISGSGGTSSFPIGFRFTSYGANLLVEDCRFSYFGIGLLIQSWPEAERVVNVSLRRNVIRNSYSTGVHSQGIFATRLDNFLIEENVWDHNGWHQTIPGAGATIFNRNLYLSQNSNVTVRGNIDARGASGGIQLRMGGLAERNLSLDNPVGIYVGHAENPSGSTWQALVRHNVLLGSRDVTPQLPHGWGIAVSFGADGVEVSDNIVSRNELANVNLQAIFIHGPVVNDVLVRDNIVYRWDDNNRGTAFALTRENMSVQNVRVEDNYFSQNDIGTLVYLRNGVYQGLSFAGNRYFSGGQANRWFNLAGQLMGLADFTTLVGEQGATVLDSNHFPDPDRNIASYAASLGLQPSIDGFMHQVNQQSRANYRPDYTSDAVINYIREGFGRAPLPPQ